MPVGGFIFERALGWETLCQPMGIEPPSFEAFFEAEHDRLFRALCLITGNRHEAEEVMQDAFLSLWERWDRVGSLEDPVGYLYRTAMNGFRKRYRRAAVALKKALVSARREPDFEAVEARDLVVKALGTLTPRQRACIVLTDLLDYSSEEAGVILGVSASTVRVLTSRARAAMRRSLGGTV